MIEKLLLNMILYVVKWSFYQEHISHDDCKCITCIWRSL